MPTTSISLHIVSTERKKVESFKNKGVCSNYFPLGGHIVKRSMVYELCMFKYSSSDYATDLLVESAIAHMTELQFTKSRLDQLGVSLELEVRISGVNDTDPEPGVCFPMELLSICNDLGASIKYTIKVKPCAVSSQYRGGVYLEIRGLKKGDFIDFDKINNISGANASYIFREGYPGKNQRILDFNGWEMAIAGDNISIEEAQMRMVNTIKDASLLGQYIKNSKHMVYIDIGHYGMPSTVVKFSIGHKFIAFCCDLNVSWVDVDIMI